MRTIGVIVAKGPGAKGTKPYIQDEKVHKKLLNEVHKAVGTKSPWELWEEKEKANGK